MRERGYRHMPVVRGGELVGVVSLRDLMRVAEIGPPEVPRGLKGVVVADTEVGDVRGNEGFYHYRQYSAIELAERRPLEDVWRLMIDGALPGQPGRAGRASAPRSHPCGRCRPSVVPVLPAIARSSSPMEGLRTTLSLVAASRGMRPTIDLDAAERRRDALLLCAVTPTVLCALHRLATGRAPIPPDPELGWAANYLWMMQGAAPADEHVWAIEQLPHLDDRPRLQRVDLHRPRGRLDRRRHGRLPRRAPSARSSGPLHGGAPSRALALLDEIGGPECSTSPTRPPASMPWCGR